MKRIWVVLIILALVVLAGILWWKNGVSPASPSSKTYSLFIVPKGAGVRAIANDLKQKGFIKDQVVFFLLTKKLGIDKKIEAGDYRISPSMDAEAIAKGLTHGTLDIWVTIPEGYRASEIAESLRAIPTYEKSWDTQLEQNEGSLFPDTYLFSREASIDLVIKTFRDTFNARYQTLPASNKFSEGEIVAIASLVEREARHAEDRPIVASVIINRLDIGMKLDLDASVQYAIGNEKKWWPALTDSAKNILPLSPYNTYTHAGLPPTPISNPGLDSLRAAIRPSNTPYLFYFTDKNGVNHYAKTLKEHEANISKYGL